MNTIDLATPHQRKLGVQAFFIVVENIFGGPADIQGWAAGPTGPGHYAGTVLETDRPECLAALCEKVELWAGDIEAEALAGAGNTCRQPADRLDMYAADAARATDRPQLRITLDAVNPPVANANRTFLGHLLGPDLSAAFAEPVFTAAGYGLIRATLQVPARPNGRWDLVDHGQRWHVTDPWGEMTIVPQYELRDFLRDGLRALDDDGGIDDFPCATFDPTAPSSPAAPAANSRYICGLCGDGATFRIHHAGKRIGDLCQTCTDRAYGDDELPDQTTVTPIVDNRRRGQGFGAVIPPARLPGSRKQTYAARLAEAKAALERAEANAQAGVDRARALRAAYGTEKATEIIQSQADELFAA